MNRILIVEDEAIIRMDLKVMLETAGYKVVEEVSNGEIAIERALSIKPDLILMDIKMPKLNGLKASEIIGKQLDVPIVIITAYSQKEFVSKAKQDNIVGYLVKPISEKNLLPTIEIALHQAEKAKTLKTEADEAKQNIERRKVIETAKGLVMKRKQMSEDEAYKYMRNLSMSNRMQLHELAQQIIKKINKEKA